ncbi:conserved Plasmodium protein, unknown function [Plasmodium vivax]|uniref:(malaria parasite P. vivax) hypothetical protein n=1 Tax=Plasmodium vivax TaxID=5855 RepID=A0A1G4HI39_PLAVI|nr:unnamed protein product [Plasmodium vivax]CAI7722662.1 conserved protein, unknown function [Plasmodium vivax]SCO74597.1 conserved Plasmodium protein, unknown function [Plasmodium vivax]VUZ98073.1 conserved protein, unknown function [Plasmodium vivax]
MPGEIMKSSPPSNASTKNDECLKKVCVINKNNAVKSEKKERTNEKVKICKLKSQCSGVKGEENETGEQGEKSDMKKQGKKSDSASSESVKESFEEEFDGEDEDVDGEIDIDADLDVDIEPDLDEDEEDEDAGGDDKDEAFADARKYFKEGQKCITPPNGDGTRAFYESLLEENPNSVIAIKYCIEHGVLSGTKHHQTIYKYNVLKKNNAFRNNFGGLRGEFIKLLEQPPKSEEGSCDDSDEELIKKESLSK